MNKAAVFILAIFTAVSLYAASGGEKLFYEKCVSCHGSSLSLNKTKSKSQWVQTVKRMKKHGLKVSGSQSKAIAEFLSGGR